MWTAPQPYKVGARARIWVPVYRRWWQFWKPRVWKEELPDIECIINSTKKIEISNCTVQPIRWT